MKHTHDWHFLYHYATGTFRKDNWPGDEVVAVTGTAWDCRDPNCMALQIIPFDPKLGPVELESLTITSPGVAREPEIAENGGKTSGT